MSVENPRNSNSSYGIILLSGTDFTNNTFFKDYEKSILNDLLKKALKQAFIRDDFPKCESTVILQFIRRYVKVFVVQNRFSYSFVEFLNNRHEYYNLYSNNNCRTMTEGRYEQMTSQEIDFLCNPIFNRLFLMHSYWEDDNMKWFKGDIHVLPDTSSCDFSKLSVRFPEGKCDVWEPPCYTIYRELCEKTCDGNTASIFGNPIEPAILPFRFIIRPNGDFEWRQSTTRYGESQYALAIYDSNAESGTTYIQNKETRSYSWITLEKASRIMEKECNYPRIINDIAQQLANAFMWNFMQLDQSDIFTITVKLSGI